MVTIIVPIFNVKEYLYKCLNSLAEQVYRNIEVILIDDGSDDGSGEICDRFVQKDERFRVLHTQNRGLSAARNLGLDNARGEWIMFVDGDDWVDTQFCQIPLQSAKKDQADLVIFGYIWEKGSRKRYTARIPECIISHESAVDLGGTVVWNKLYGRHLFDAIRFPEGHVFEDIYVTHRLIYAAQRIVMLPTYLYHHAYRNNSISNTKKQKERDDNFLFCQQRYYDLLSVGYPKEKAIVQLQNAAMSYCVRANPKTSPLFKQAATIVNSIDKTGCALRGKKRIAFRVWRVNIVLFHSICKILRLKAQ